VNHRTLMIALLLGMVCAVAQDDDPLLRKRRSAAVSHPTKAIEHTTTTTLQYEELVTKKPDPLSRGGGVSGALARVADEIANAGKGTSKAHVTWSLTIKPKLVRDDQHRTGKVTLRVTDKDWHVDSDMPPESVTACAADRVTATANLNAWSVSLTKDQLDTLANGGTLTFLVNKPFTGLQKLRGPPVKIVVAQKPKPKVVDIIVRSKGERRLTIGMPAEVEVTFNPPLEEPTCQVRLTAGHRQLSVIATNTGNDTTFLSGPFLPWYDSAEGLLPLGEERTRP
jgi:hypothetical protein